MKYRTGKHPPKRDYRTLCFGNYLAPTFPPPPAQYDGLAEVGNRLKVARPISLFPMDGNDRYGNCTMAAAAHAVTVYRGLIAQQQIPTEQSVIKTYLQLSGGIDSGLNMLDVLNYWRRHSFGGDKILAYTKVDRAKHDLIKHGIHMFGGVYLGFQCQEGLDTDFDAGRPWTPARLTQDGHAVYAVSYDETKVGVFTWGGFQWGTWDWWNECVDEAYIILPPEARQRGFASGFDFAQLQDDLNKVAHA